MKLIDQVCTVTQAFTLKALGVIQNSIFYHHRAYEAPISGETIVAEFGKQYKKIRACNDRKGAASAYTVAELCQMLPDYYPSWRFKRSEQSGERLWIATVICGPKPPGIDDIHTASAFDRHGKTQAEALATLLIALLETEAITASEVNERLKDNP